MSEVRRLGVQDLYSLEQYHGLRADFRKRVLAHKQKRQVAIGPIVTLYFEDRLTIQYQVQEMLRIERIFEREAIEEELAAYNPLIPNGANLKATLMIEVPDPDERRRELERLAGIEHRLYARVDALDPMFAIADEDLERTSEGRTAAVHFVRFELGAGGCERLKRGAALSIGFHAPEYEHVTILNDAQRNALVADLD